jgi:hypothetical protein
MLADRNEGEMQENNSGEENNTRETIEKSRTSRSEF